MSIDARIVGITKLSNCCVRLHLEPRDDRIAPAGQPCLYVENPPSPFPLVVGDEIWGDSVQIMRRDTRIARRIGYDRIIFEESIRQRRS